MKIVLSVLGLLVASQSFASYSNQNLPTLPDNLQCLDQNNQNMPFMNQQVMAWKHSTPDQTLRRAMIDGVLTKIYPAKTGHTHFAIDIDGVAGGDIEIIYNDEFGRLPRLAVGMRIAACGDYITVGPRAKRPSPMGAIIHWLHYNPGDRDNGIHKHGFLIVDNRPYGNLKSRRRSVAYRERRTY